jgi:hypothetical protein
MLTALPGCTPYVHGYAYTTHQSFSSSAPPSAPQPTPSPSVAPTPSADSSLLPSGTHSATSDRLTYYLQGHRLPLVGAQVADAGGGNYKVILYGFVATNHGKNDAEEKTRRFLNDPNAEIDNRIVVKPELRTPNPSLNAAASSFPPPASSSSTSPTQLQPAQINALIGALLMGMALVSALPTAVAPGAGAPSSGAPPSP